MRRAGFWISMSVVSAVISSAVLLPDLPFGADLWSALFVLFVNLLGVLWLVAVVTLGVGTLKRRRGLLRPVRARSAEIQPFPPRV